MEKKEKYAKAPVKEFEPVLPEGPIATDKAAQVALVPTLQGKLLRYFDNLLDRGLMSPTDAATLSRLLMQSGWNLDETSLPKGLRSKLTKAVDMVQLEEMAEGRAD
jgi:hypothetical protein